MLGRVKGKRMLECDSCNNTIEEEAHEEFVDFINQAKEAGWIVYKNVSNTWIHTCPDCRK